MVHWIYMFFVDLLVPGILAAIGILVKRHAPKDINLIYGYRTTLSMKNADTWKFANELCGKLYFRWGLIMLAVSAAVMLLILPCNETVVYTVGFILLGLQLIPVLGVIPVVERALRKTFHEDGTRK